MSGHCDRAGPVLGMLDAVQGAGDSWVGKRGPCPQRARGPVGKTEQEPARCGTRSPPCWCLVLRGLAEPSEQRLLEGAEVQDGPGWLECHMGRKRGYKGPFVNSTDVTGHASRTPFHGETREAVAFFFNVFAFRDRLVVPHRRRRKLS